MTPTNLSRAPVVAFDRLESLADPASLATILGPLARVERDDWAWWVARLTRWSSR